MSRHFLAYSGSEPYIFVSYSHKDSDRVYPIIQKLHNEDYRIWYDEGIAPTEEWRGVINEHIRDCGLFLVFVTTHSMDSLEVVKECTYAINLHKPLHIIYLDNVPDSQINANLLADFANSQRVHAYELHSSVFERRIREPLTAFRGSEEANQAQTAEKTLSVTAKASPSTSGTASIDTIASEIWRDTVKGKISLGFTIASSLIAAAVLLSFAMFCVFYLNDDNAYPLYFIALFSIGIFPVFFAVLLIKSYSANKSIPQMSALQFRKKISSGSRLCCVSIFCFSIFFIFLDIIVGLLPIGVALVVVVLPALFAIISSRVFSKRVCDVLSQKTVHAKKFSSILRLAKISSAVFICLAVLSSIIDLYIYFTEYFSGYPEDIYLFLCSIATLIALFFHHTYFRTLFQFGSQLAKAVQDGRTD